MRSEPIIMTGTTLVVPLLRYDVPMSLALTSSAAGRKIELSFDGGIEYHDATASLNYSSATQLVLAIEVPCQVKCTGAANDIVTITTKKTIGD